MTQSQTSTRAHTTCAACNGLGRLGRLFVFIDVECGNISALRAVFCTVCTVYGCKTVRWYYGTASHTGYPVVGLCLLYRAVKTYVVRTHGPVCALSP